MIDDDGFVCFFNDWFIGRRFLHSIAGSVYVSNSVITGNSAVSILTSIWKTWINIVEI